MGGEFYLHFVRGKSNSISLTGLVANEKGPDIKNSHTPAIAVENKKAVKDMFKHYHLLLLLGLARRILCDSIAGAVTSVFEPGIEPGKGIIIS